MDTNQLIDIIKKKLITKIDCDHVAVEDKTFLHKDHKSHDKNRYHIKIIITSNYLKKKKKIQATKEIYKILDLELKKYIHSIQILIN